MSETMGENSMSSAGEFSELNSNGISNGAAVNTDHGWKTVSYQKKGKKQPLKQQGKSGAAGGGIVPDPRNDVFRSIEQHSEERRKKLIEAQMAASAGENSVAVDDDGEEGSDAEGVAVANGTAAGEEKKSKPKKPKKPKITVAEAASKIDSSDLVAFLADICASYETQQDIQLMRFADYFGRSFAKVSSSQFPWMKILKESSVARMVDIPVSNISEDVYKISTDWLNQRSIEALGSFVVWSLDSIFSDLALHHGAAKGNKKAVQQASSKSQVAIFVVLAMTLRRKPDVLISLVPILKDNAKYHGQEKLPVIAWVITQASQGDLVVGLFMWVHFLLPMLGNKSYANPQCRDMILQVVERIISMPKARNILVNGAVRKGERVVPPSALDTLMKYTFPANSARVKATERFEGIYPTLKDVALTVSPEFLYIKPHPGSRKMKQLTQQIIPFTIKAAGEGVPELAREAGDVFIWCLTENPDSYKQWDDIYLENLEASVVILKKLCDDWNVLYAKHSNFEPLKAALKNFIVKNEKALAGQGDPAYVATLKDAQKHSKILMGRVSRGNGCIKALVFLAVLVAIFAALMTDELKSEIRKVLVDLNSKLSPS